MVINVWKVWKHNGYLSQVEISSGPLDGGTVSTYV